VSVSPEAFATVQYSSGATGMPKGVLLTHHAMLNNVRAMRDAMDLGANDVSVNWVPLYHDMGLMGAFLLPLLSGCPTVLIPTMDFMRDPILWLRTISAIAGRCRGRRTSPTACAPRAFRPPSSTASTCAPGASPSPPPSR
jgi:acyl-CoA synthetase (AMP-forming)/AMP-acid ligase II